MFESVVFGSLLFRLGATILQQKRAERIIILTFILTFGHSAILAL
jgi:hypothetical protein